MSDTLEPGLFPGITRDTYDRLPAVNFSTLKHVKRSPAHARHAQLNPSAPTPAQELGTLIHAYLLEPDRFARDFVELPDLTQNLKTKNGDVPKVPTATAEYKARLSEFGQAHMGRTIVSLDDMEICRGIGESIAGHETVAHLVSLGDSELAIVWQDSITGLWCKGLIDQLCGDTILDLKTTDDASPGPFGANVARHQWHVQAAWYLTGLKAIGRPARRFVHVPVETAPPHGVAVYELDDAALDQGLRDARAYLDSWAKCVQCGRWPAYRDQVQPLSLPRYAINEVGT